MLDKRAPNWISRQGLTVADYDLSISRPSQSHIHPAFILQKTDMVPVFFYALSFALIFIFSLTIHRVSIILPLLWWCPWKVRTHSREHDDVLFLALERIDGADLHSPLKFLRELISHDLLEFQDLSLIGRYKANLDWLWMSYFLLGNKLIKPAEDLYGQLELSYVLEWLRLLRLNRVWQVEKEIVLPFNALQPGRPLSWLNLQCIYELILIELLGRELADGRVHPVLFIEKVRLESIVQDSLEQATVVLREVGVWAEGGRRQLLGVADQDHAFDVVQEGDERGGLGALAGLVDYQCVEVVLQEAQLLRLGASQGAADHVRRG